MMNNYRNLTIDIVKGAAAILLVWGHFIQLSMWGTELFFENKVFIIYSFHMSLFALISGYLFGNSLKKRNLREFLTSRVTGFLLPVVSWSLIDWLLNGILHGTISLFGLWKNLTGTFLWFLWSIFAAQLISSLIEKKIPVQYRWLGFIGGYFLMYCFPNPEMNLFLYPFIVIGFLCNKKDISTLKMGNWIWISVPIWITLLLFFNKECYIYTTGISVWKSEIETWRHLLINCYRYVIGFTGSISVILLINVISKSITKINKFATFGKYSMQIYILQGFAFKIYSKLIRILIDRMGYNPLIENQVLLSLVYTPIMAMVLCIVMIGITKIIEKMHGINLICFGR